MIRFRKPMTSPQGYGGMSLPKYRRQAVSRLADDCDRVKHSELEHEILVQVSGQWSVASKIEETETGVIAAVSRKRQNEAKSLEC